MEYFKDRTPRSNIKSRELDLWGGFETIYCHFNMLLRIAAEKSDKNKLAGFLNVESNKNESTHSV
jgi:hypothetical protein